MNRFVLAILILLNIQLAYGQLYDNSTLPVNITLDNKFKSYIDSIILNFLEVNHVPGVALALVKDTSTLYMRGYGLAAIDQRNSVTINSAFDIASNTKLFTATAIMQLYEKGLIALDSPVVNYIPYFKIKGQYQEITIRHLLNHTSGMVRDMSIREESQECMDCINCLEYHIRSLNKRKLLSIPGKVYSYSNVGYSILAKVVSEVSKLPYEHYVKKNILEPLGMNSSFFVGTNIVNKVAHHKIRKSKAILIKNDYMNCAANGNGGLFSSVYDLNIWAKTFLANGQYRNQIIIQDSTFKMMLLSSAKTGYNCN